MQAIRRAEVAAIRAARGNFTDQLDQKVKGLSAGDKLELAFWLPVPQPAIDKNDPMAVMKLDAEQQAALAMGRKAVQAELVKVGHNGQGVGAGPMFVVELTRAQAAALQFAKLPGMVSSPPDYAVPQGYSTVWGNGVQGWGTGNTGSGVKVCVIEKGRPNHVLDDGITLAATHNPAGSPTDGHSAQMISYIRNTWTGTATPGLANSADIHLANHESITGVWYPEGQWCKDQGATVWNFSQCPAGANCGVGTSSPTASDRYFNYLATVAPWPTIVTAAGNYGHHLVPTYPFNRLKNGLVVGAALEGADADCATYAPSATRSQHAFALYSRFWNPPSTHSDRELPHLVGIGGPGPNCLQWGNAHVGGGGTSAATAMVSGAAAQAQGVSVDLKSWPEATRAILLATADESVSGVELDLDDTVDDRDGAGEVNAEGAANLAGTVKITSPSSSNPKAAGYTFGSMDFTNDFTALVYNTRYYIKVDQTRNVRVALTWNSVTDCSDPTTCSPTVDDPLTADLDMTVSAMSGSGFYWSTSYDNAYEFIHFTAQAGVTYEIRIDRTPATNAPSTYFGLAWSYEGL